MSDDNAFDNTEKPSDARRSSVDQRPAEPENPFQSPESLFDTSTTTDGADYHGEKLNPWFSMMYRPRDTIRYIVATDPTRHVLLLACLGGFATTLNRMLQRDTVAELSIPAILATGAGTGVITGLLTVYVVSIVVRGVSAWLGGIATLEQLRAAAAWCSIPSIWSLIVSVPLLAIYGGDVVSRQIRQADGNTALRLGLMTMAILSFWQAIIYFQLCSEVNRFSSVRAIGASLITAVLILGPILVIIGLFLSGSR